MFGAGNITTKDHSHRSPLPPVWPEIAEDLYFSKEPGMANIMIDDKDIKLEPVMVNGRQAYKTELKVDKVKNVIAEPFPSWKTLLVEVEESREKMRKGTLEFDTQQRNPHFQAFGTFDPSLAPATPAALNIYNISHFNTLPSVMKWRESYLKTLIDWRVLRNEEQLHAAHSELLHTMYHLALWRADGRRVYVLDETLYTMLGHTELPQFPLDMLAFRQHSFYIKIPSRSFAFSVPNLMTGGIDREYAEGIMVSIDETQPDTGKQREIAFVVCGEGTSTVGGANTAYITAGLGPDGKMSDVKFTHGSDYAKGDEQEFLTKIMPRVVLGLCLYMQSEHPDLEPVPATPRRDLGAIKSNRKKAKVIRRISKQSKLGYIYVGKRVAEIEAHEFQKRITIVGMRGHKLEKPVWVSGHWRQQKVGVGRKGVRVVWIRPYRKGPDFDETLKIRAARVQPAQAKDH
jgi:hypothetical protein